MTGVRTVTSCRYSINVGTLVIISIETNDVSGLSAFQFDLECSGPGVEIASWNNSSIGGIYSIMGQDVEAEGNRRRIIGFSQQPLAKQEIVVGSVDLRIPPGWKAEEIPVRIASGSVLTGDGMEKVVVNEEGEFPSITTTGVARVYPNPFNPNTLFEFSVAIRARVTIRIFDISGRMIRTLVDEVMEPSPNLQTVTWNGTDMSSRPVSSGVYFWRFTAGDRVQSGRAVLLK